MNILTIFHLNAIRLSMLNSQFLTAEWRHLIMINYEVDPAVLMPYLPKGTELDLWEGRAYMSLVGFMFQNARVGGISFPFHRNFEEVNLRFYIKCQTPEGTRRGVAFIKEIVPRWAIAFIARYFYNEKYIALPMRHKIEQGPSQIDVEYEWKFNGKWQKLGVKCLNEPEPIKEGSEVEFIAEHYWGYSVQRDGGTKAYQVQHPKWRVWNVDSYQVDVDVKNLYGPELSPFLEKSPTSCFLAEGSKVQVFKPTIIF